MEESKTQLTRMSATSKIRCKSGHNYYERFSIYSRIRDGEARCAPIRRPVLKIETNTYRWLPICNYTMAKRDRIGRDSASPTVSFSFRGATGVFGIVPWELNYEFEILLCLAWLPARERKKSQFMLFNYRPKVLIIANAA